MDIQRSFLERLRLAHLEQWAEVPAMAFAALLGIGLVYTTATVLYRIFFHPLSRFPGPKVLAITDITSDWRSYIRGTWIHEVQALHREYGPVVRIGTNHLALDGSVGWPTLAHRTGKPEFGKQPGFYFGQRDLSILGAENDMHRRQRRQLSHAFSDSALNEQGDLILKYVDMLVQQLETRAQKGETVNITDWMNFTTFDIIGDLAVSTPFRCLEAGKYHPWVTNFFASIEGSAASRFVRFYPYLKPLVGLVKSRGDTGMDLRQIQMTMGITQGRMALGVQKEGKKDFMTYMLRSNRDGEDGMSDMEILTNAPVLMGAGSETTATALAGFFYFLGTTPRAYQRLVHEIRSAFRSEEEITLRYLAKLEYLQACLEESLRLYPAVAITPPRICPGAEIDGKWVPQGTIISIHQYATFRNPEHFADPEVFVPERFLPAAHRLFENKYASDNRAVFKPFSYGSRDCIGKNLAFAEMRAVVAKLLFRFDFQLAPGQEDWIKRQKTFVMWHKGALKLSFGKRS
ncbi:cytochrome P450 [Xylariaceae sp. FL1019]|nr:cytochrome P450 [Xylariaceae sp. FL1019]